MGLGQWLTQQACRRLQNWRSLGFNPKYIGVPVAAAQLNHPQFVPHLAEMLREINFEPSELVLNISTIGLVYSENMNKTFHMLNHLGIKIAIDDFGSGDFSFKLLKYFNIDCLKLDAIFIKDFVKNDKSQVLVNAIFTLAATLNIMLVIKGIENEEQRKLLQVAGYQYLQGRLLTSSLSAEKKIPQMLEEEHSAH